MAVLLLFLNDLLSDLPQSALAAVVIAAALSLLNLGALRRYWPVRPSAVVLSLVASLGVILVGVLQGIVIAIFLAVLLFFRRNWWPHGAVLGEVDGLDGWHSVEIHDDAREQEGIVVYRWEAPLFFANAGAFRRQIRHLVRERQPRWIVVQCEAVTDVDLTAAAMLEQLDKELNAQGIHMAFVELRTRLQDLVKRYGLLRHARPRPLLSQHRHRARSDPRRRGRGTGGTPVTTDPEPRFAGALAAIVALLDDGRADRRRGRHPVPQRRQRRDRPRRAVPRRRGRLVGGHGADAAPRNRRRGHRRRPRDHRRRDRDCARQRRTRIVRAHADRRRPARDHLRVRAGGDAARVPPLHIRTHARPARRGTRSCCATPGPAAGRSNASVWSTLARELGVETVMLDHGLDLEQLARDAVARGADCLGMAGGDGSQALVASIAVEHGLPFVCVSAGPATTSPSTSGSTATTHGQSMYAFRDAVERKVDYATVNGRFFVNNVSLGVYAKIVQEDSYRDAKVDTTKTLLPQMLGRQAEPFDLQFTTPDGDDVDGAILIMVSNNAYVIGTSPDNAQRRHLDRGELGVFAVNTSTGSEAARLFAASAIGQRTRSQFWKEFTTAEFEVRSQLRHRVRRHRWRSTRAAHAAALRAHPRGLTLLVPERQRRSSRTAAGARRLDPRPSGDRRGPRTEVDPPELLNRTTASERVAVVPGLPREFHDDRCGMAWSHRDDGPPREG